MECNAANAKEDYYDYIVKNPFELEALQDTYPSACLESFGARYAFLHIPLSEMPGDLSMRALVDRTVQFGYMGVPKLFGLMDTASVEATGALRVQNQSALNLRGQGTIIGIIDTGINWTLPSFRNEDGTSRILGLWDQTLENGAEPPMTEPFMMSYGTYYSAAELNRALTFENPYALIPSRDEENHGTFLAGIAAGRNSEEPDANGVAPGCALAVVRLKQAKQYLKTYFAIPDGVPAYSEIDIMNGVQFLTELAYYYRRPMVILLGLGTNQGGHDGRMPLADYLSRITESVGMAVVQAAGNEAAARRHYYSRLQQGLSDRVEIRVGANVSGFTVELWGNSLNTYRIGLVSPSGRQIEPVSLEGRGVYEYVFPLDGSRVYVHDKITTLASGDELVFLHFQTPSEGIWVVQIEVQGNFSTDYHMWLPIRQFAPESVYFLEANPYTTITSNACAAGTITTGMLDYRLNTLSAESSKGYTRSGLVKPDLLAPGVNVGGVAADGSIMVRTGTSVAAAHTAGAAALLLEYGIVQGNATYLDGNNVRTLLIRGAKRQEGVEYPNRDQGYGVLDVYGVFHG